MSGYRRSDEEVAATEAAPESRGVGYEETLPGQEEIIAGTPRHEELLNDPRATHYSGEHNVVIGVPTVVDVPFAQQVGSELTCTMGNWTGAPTEYSYQWQFDGADAGTGTPLALTGSEVGMTATCIVTATGEGGTTTASPSNPVVVAA